MLCLRGTLYQLLNKAVTEFIVAQCARGVSLVPASYASSGVSSGER